MNKILESPLFQHPRPWWLPLLSFGITLYGIIVLGWNLKPIIFLFWWEVILIVAAALVRMLTALDGRPAADILLLFTKVKLLIGGVIFGGMFIMFAVVFTFKAFTEGDNYSGLSGIYIQTRLMVLGYIAGLILHYFGNGRFKTASPGGELMQPFVQLLVLMAFLQALTMHLIPSYLNLNQAKWIAVAVVSLKFVVDLLFARIGKPFREVLQANN